MPKEPLDVVKDNLGRRVRELRRSLQLSQSELAAKVGSYQEFISDVERGEANVTLDSLVKIALALGIDTTELFSSKQHSSRKQPRLPTK